MESPIIMPNCNVSFVSDTYLSWTLNFKCPLPTTNFVIVFNESIEDTDLTCYLLFKPIKNNAPSALVPVDKMEG